MTQPSSSDTPTQRPSVRTPFAIGVIAAGINAVGGGLILDNNITLGSWAAGVAAVSIGSIIGRRPMAVAIGNASGSGSDFWRAVANFRKDKSSPSNSGARVMGSVGSLGAIAATLAAAYPMAQHGATLANVALSVGVAGAALAASGSLDMVIRVREQIKAEEDGAAPTPEKRKRMGL